MAKKNKQDENLTGAQIVVHKYPSFIEWGSKAVMGVSSSRYMLWFSLCLLAAAVVIYYPTLGDDYDIWFHLKYGEHYVKNLTWTIDHAQYSWTPAMSDWKYVTWIGSSILYVIYSLASAPGLYIFQYLVLLLIASICLYYALRVMGDSLDLTHVMWLLMLAVALKLTAIYIKPELFSTLFFTITLFIYYRAKALEKYSLFLYPVLFAIWVNTHGGFIIGLAFISIALFGEVINYMFLKRSAMSKKLLGSFAISVGLSYLAIMINPHGPYYHTALFEYLTSKEYMGSAGLLFAYLNLWDYLAFTTNMYNFVNTAWVFVAMAGLLVAALVYVYLKNKRVDAAIIILNAVFFYVGMNSARATMFFPLIGFFSILYILKKAEALQIKRKFAPAALIVLIVLFVVALSTLRYVDHRSWLGIGAYEYVPVKEVEFIKKNNLPGPIFNDYVIGAYMMWTMYPDYKVFIDPRYGPYVKQLMPEWFEMSRNPTPETLQKVVAKYPFKVALLQMRELNLIFALLNSPDWRLVYFDNVAVVLIHKSLIPLLSKEALATDVAPKRFAGLRNPRILMNLFEFYVRIGPVFAREILYLYRQNVSEWYFFRKEHIAAMEIAIQNKELELQQKTDAAAKNSKK